MATAGGFDDFDDVVRQLKIDEEKLKRLLDDADASDDASPYRFPTTEVVLWKAGDTPLEQLRKHEYVAREMVLGGRPVRCEIVRIALRRGNGGVWVEYQRRAPEKLPDGWPPS